MIPHGHRLVLKTSEQTKDCGYFKAGQPCEWYILDENGAVVNKGVFTTAVVYSNQLTLRNDDHPERLLPR